MAVTGGIAAYKVADCVSRLRKTGAEVRVAMTEAATRFVQPLTFESLCGHPVYSDVFARPSAWEMEHIAWARWADALLIAPATANVIAKLAHGLADDAVTTLALAFTGPVWVAPAMNTAMLNHRATRHNLELLAARGVRVIEPGAGLLACGEVGPGRLAEPEELIAALARGLGGERAAGSLAGRRILITAGPTREPLDPIRFISNRSTGRMGAELAAEALARGAQVRLIHGPLAVAIPPGCDAVPAETARAMLDAVQQAWPETDIAIFAAAVANYEGARVAGGKLKGGETLTLALRRTPDIAAWAGANRRPGQVLVGFAAESEDLIAAARRKLQAKRLDLICANPIGEPGIGFTAEQNRVTLLTGDEAAEPVTSPTADKRAIAAWILDHVEQRLAAAT